MMQRPRDEPEVTEEAPLEGRLLWLLVGVTGRVKRACQDEQEIVENR